MVQGIQATNRSLFRVIRGGGTSDDWAEQFAEAAEGDVLAKAIEHWKSKGILPEGLLDLMDPEFRSRGVSLAHQWDRDFLTEIYDSLARAIAEGKTFPDWMQEAQKSLDRFGAAPNAPRLADGPRWKPSYADLVYRQNTSNAFNAGRYAEMFSRKWVGQIPYWQFYAIEDSRNCPSGVCRALDGKVFEKGSAKARMYLPPLHFQCFPGDVVVSGRANAALQASYSGELIKLTTQRGARLAVTPNHPVLTSKGFAPAHSLRQGDHVLNYGSDRVGPALGTLDVDAQNDPSPIEELFHAMDLRGFARSVPASGTEFYGDSRSMHGDVRVVAAHRELLRDREAKGPERGSRLVFEQAATREAIEMGPGHFDLGLEGLRLSARGLPGRAALSPDGVRVGLDGGPLQVFRFGSASDSDAAVTQPPREGSSADPGLVAELLQRGSGRVALDEIVEVGNEEFRGHVFDLQSPVGWIVANGIVTSNCRCYTRELDPEDMKDGGYKVADPGKLRDAGVAPLKGFDTDSVEELVPQVLRGGNLEP